MKFIHEFCDLDMDGSPLTILSSVADQDLISFSYTQVIT